MMWAITMTYARLRQAGIRGGLVASVHDELLLEVSEDDAEAARAILQQTMIDAFTETFPGAPTTNLVTVHTGVSWFAVKEE
jgi:DNA polymerase I-like protein with 3'-5' exonuclease and polymerase domains